MQAGFKNNSQSSGPSRFSKRLRFFGIIFLAFLAFAAFRASFLGRTPMGNFLLGVICILLIAVIAAVPLLKKRHLKDVPVKAKMAPAVQPGAPLVPQKPQELIGVEFHRVDPDEDIQAPKGAVISYLDARALMFWNGKRTDYQIPSYYEQTAFGRNVGPALPRLLQNGYLGKSSIEKNISLQKVPELKAILAEKELKVSGTKPELVHRLLDNLDPEELEDLFPVGTYIITKKGETALEPYSIVFANSTYHLGFSAYRLLREKEKTPESSDEDILIRAFSEDIQQCYKEGDMVRYQTTMSQAASFMQMISQPKKSLECEILAFFVWTRQVESHQMDARTQSYYMAMNIEREGQVCGYTLQQLFALFEETIKANNPFGLASNRNIQKAIAIFKDSLSIK